MLRIDKEPLPEGFSGVLKTQNYKKYYKFGNLHRTNGPAVEYKTGVKSWYQGGVLHRKKGPAVEFPNGEKLFYSYGLLHNEKGPAKECLYGNYYYLYGLEYSKEKWEELTKRTK